MGNVVSVLYILIYLWAGVQLAKRVFPGESRLLTVPLGCAFATALLAMVPAALAMVLGFALPAMLLAAAQVLAAGAWAWQSNRPDRQRAKLMAAFRRSPILPPEPDAAQLRQTVALLAVAVPGVLLTVYLLHTHVLRYDAATGAYYTGQSGYGDVAMHLAFIKSIAVQGKMPPDYSLLAGQPVFGYPFLCESISSVFVVLGASLKVAYILPEIPALVSIFGFVWLLARRALGSAGKALLTAALFFFGGGFGFAYFMGS